MSIILQMEINIRIKSEFLMNLSKCDIKLYMILKSYYYLRLNFVSYNKLIKLIDGIERVKDIKTSFKKIIKENLINSNIYSLYSGGIIIGLKNILIVDGKKNVLNTLNRVLKKHYLVQKANSGIEGLNCFKKNRFDIVITNNEMPHMSGEEMIKEIRKIDKRIPVILITDNRKTKPEIKESDLLYKPFSMKTLIDVINTNLNNNHILRDPL